MPSIGFSVAQVTLFVLVSLSIGAIVALWLSPSARQARELRFLLEQTQAELARYKNDVTDHFIKTADHFRDVTTQYHQLFEHLRTSAHTLCDDERLQSQLAAVRMPSKSLLDPTIANIVTAAQNNQTQDNSDSECSKRTEETCV